MTLSNMLAAGEMPDGSNPCCSVLEECGGLDTVESLQEHENYALYDRAQKIIETYFNGEETEVEADIGSNQFLPSLPTTAQAFTF